MRLTLLVLLVGFGLAAAAAAPAFACTNSVSADSSAAQTAQGNPPPNAYTQ